MSETSSTLTNEQDPAAPAPGTCPKCGSTKIRFDRELVAKNSKKKVSGAGAGIANVGPGSGHSKGRVTNEYVTTGICQNCGYTWNPNGEPEKKKDEVVNQFISSYNAVSSSPFTDIERGNISQKAFAYSYNYYFELLHAANTDAIAVTINATTDTANLGVSGMKNAFHDTIKAMNPNIADDTINSYFDTMVKGAAVLVGPKWSVKAGWSHTSGLVTVNAGR